MVMNIIHMVKFYYLIIFKSCEANVKMNYPKKGKIFKNKTSY